MVSLREPPGTTANDARKPTYEQLEQMLACKDREIEQERQAHQQELARERREKVYLRKWQQKTRDIMTNPNASTTFRVLSWAQLDLYPDAVLNGGTVHIDVKKVYQHVTVSDRQTSNYFKATKEVGGAEYDFERGQNEETGRNFTESGITYAPTFGTTALAASPTVQKARAETNRRNAEKTRALEAAKCSRCGKPHSHAAILPYCETCGQIDDAAQGQLIELAKLRVVEEQEPEQKEEPVTPEQEPAHATAAANHPIVDTDDTPFCIDDAIPEEPSELSDIPFPTDEDAPEPGAEETEFFFDTEPENAETRVPAKQEREVTRVTPMPTTRREKEPTPLFAPAQAKGNAYPACPTCHDNHKVSPCITGEGYKCTGCGQMFADERIAS